MVLLEFKCWNSLFRLHTLTTGSGDIRSSDVRYSFWCFSGQPSVRGMGKHCSVVSGVTYSLW